MTGNLQKTQLGLGVISINLFNTTVIMTYGNIISLIKIGKSPGPDQIHPRILYETRDVVYYPLFLIFNQSFKTGVLPYDCMETCRSYCST